MCNTPQRWSPGVQHTAEMISALCNIPQRLSLQCATYHGDHLCCVQHTMKMISAVCTRFSTPIYLHDSNPSEPLMNRLKYFRIWFWFCRDIQSQSGLRGVHPTAEIISAVCITLWSRRLQTLKKYPRCAAQPRDLKCSYITNIFYLHIFSFIIDVFTWPWKDFTWLSL